MKFKTILERTVAAWIGMCTLLLLIRPIDLPVTKDSFSAIPIWVFLLCIIAAFIIMTLFHHFTKFKHADTWLFAAAISLFLLLVAVRAEDIFTSSACVVLLVIVLFYIQRQIPNDHIPTLGKKATTILVIIILAVIGCYVAWIGYMRYRIYASPTYDYGIFNQMFYYMKETFTPLTTCERDGLLSHFAVHLSPIYYLLLPIYLLFPYGATLNIAQGFIVSLSILPMFFLCRAKKLSRLTSLILCLITALFPALTGGTLYDIHENCFLLPLLLTLFCFYERRQLWPLYICSILVLCVKEDAAIYLAFFAIYILLDDRNMRKHGAILLALSIAWFMCASILLAAFGEGTMTDRYADYISEDGGLLSMVANLIRTPSLALQISFSFSEEKITFILLMLLPLLFLPFVTKRMHRYILICPMVLINLMTTYLYQFDIGFQYVFGSGAFLLYAAILNLSDLPQLSRRRIIPMILGATILLFSAHIAAPNTFYFSYYAEQHQRITVLDEALTKIPDHASVTASSFLLPHLAQREELYDLDYTNKQTEWVAIELSNENNKNAAQTYQENGYQTVYQVDDVICILQKTSS